MAKAEVTLKLTVADFELVLESLRERNKLLHDHATMKVGGKSPEEIRGRRESREKSMRLHDILNQIEGK
jgi:hypothetical protein